MEQKNQTHIATGNLYVEQNINSNRAKSIARKFLERYYTIIMFKAAILEGKIWTVIMDVGHKEEHIVHIKMDAETGRIMNSY